MQPKRVRPVVLPSIALSSSLLFIACAQRVVADSQDAERGDIVAPLVLEGSAYEAANGMTLPAVPPTEGPGLHNVYQLSENIISGAEPEGPEALEQIATWGVKTILSVDGKAPDAETAAELGMRYVHVPIEYAGMSGEELVKISKTFRELEGPFYVHCYHGKHRGPAAAAIGRIVLDEVPRERAIAEMRQWCATSSKYEGLYSSVATARIPSGAESARSDFDFESAHSFEGMRATMIQFARKWDWIKLANKNAWAEVANHPDVDPRHEAVQLHELFETCASLPEIRAWPDDFRGWLQDGREGSAQLERALNERARLLSAQVEDTALLSNALAEADTAFARIGNSCSACHDVYRN